MKCKPIFIFLLILLRGHAGLAQVEVRDEPKHRPVLENGVVRVLDVWIRGGDSCKFHIHRTPSLFLYLSKTSVRTQEQGAQAVEQRVEPGQSWYNNFNKPFIHKAWVRDAESLHAIDIELLGPLPSGKSTPLEASGLSLIQDSVRHRTYRVSLPPGTRVQVQLRGNPVIAIPYIGDGALKVGTVEGDLFQGQYQYVEKDKWIEWRNTGEGRMEGYLYEIKQ